MTVKEKRESELLRAENQQLKELLAQALARIAELEAKIVELEAAKSDPPPFIKPSTPKKDDTLKQPRRKRSPQYNNARRQETPTHIIEYKVLSPQCPDCGYPLRTPSLAQKRQVIELPPPQLIHITEHQIYTSWCARCSKWHYPPPSDVDSVCQDHPQSW